MRHELFRTDPQRWWLLLLLGELELQPLHVVQWFSFPLFGINVHTLADASHDRGGKLGVIEELLLRELVAVKRERLPAVLELLRVE